MNEKIEIIVGGIGGASAVNSTLKKIKKEDLSWIKITLCLIKAFVRGAVVTWGILGLIVHWLEWIKDWHIQVFAAIIIGQLSLMILDYIELSFEKIVIEFLKNIPEFFKFIIRSMKNDKDEKTIKPNKKQNN